MNYVTNEPGYFFKTITGSLVKSPIYVTTLPPFIKRCSVVNR